MQCIRIALAAVAVALLAAVPAAAQETINYASVSGRVTDPQGAVVRRGARSRRGRSRPTSPPSAVTDGAGRFRFPYLRVGPYELSVSGRVPEATRRSDARRPARPSRSRSSLTVGGRRGRRHGQRRLAAARVGAQPDCDDRRRSGSRQPAAQRPQLPRHRGARARRRAAQHQQHAALRRDVGRARAWACRSAASATSRTTSSSTGCRPTTMRPA